LKKYTQIEYDQRLQLLTGSKAFLEGDLETAELKLRQFVENYDSEMDYDLASGRLRLGMVYDLLGNRTEAINQYQKVIELDNRSSAVLEAKVYLNTPFIRENTR